MSSGRGVHLSRDEFEALVVEVLDGLPEDIARHLQNVEVVVAWAPTPDQLRRVGLSRGQTLLGLYEGVPLTERGHFYGLVLPDKITIFQGPLQQMARDVDDLRYLVRRTVLHELAHHFGISDERLRELGAY